MAAETLEERVAVLESKLQAVERHLTATHEGNQSVQRGWRWFVGIDANNPHFESAARLGQEWRYADRPKDNGDAN